MHISLPRAKTELISPRTLIFLATLPTPSVPHFLAIYQIFLKKSTYSSEDQSYSLLNKTRLVRTGYARGLQFLMTSIVNVTLFCF